jgi:hypothetical protein
MNRSLYEYCLGRKQAPRTQTGKAVQQLISSAFSSEISEDSPLLNALAAALRDGSALDDDVFALIKPLHGCGGSEGYVLDVSPAAEYAFWKSLAEQFPDHQGLNYVAADAALLAGDRDAARRHFMNGLRLDPDVCPPSSVDWDELLRGTEWYFEYRLYLLSQARADGPAMASEMSTDLASEYCDDPEKLKLIDAVARGAGVPRPM